MRHERSRQDAFEVTPVFYKLQRYEAAHVAPPPPAPAATTQPKLHPPQAHRPLAHRPLAHRPLARQQMEQPRRRRHRRSNIYAHGSTSCRGCIHAPAQPATAPSNPQ